MVFINVVIVLSRRRTWRLSMPEEEREATDNEASYIQRDADAGANCSVFI